MQRRGYQAVGRNRTDGRDMIGCAGRLRHVFMLTSQSLTPGQAVWPCGASNLYHTVDELKERSGWKRVRIRKRADGWGGEERYFEEGMRVIKIAKVYFFGFLTYKGDWWVISFLPQTISSFCTCSVTFLLWPMVYMVMVAPIGAVGLVGRVFRTYVSVTVWEFSLADGLLLNGLLGSFSCMQLTLCEKIVS